MAGAQSGTVNRDDLIDLPKTFQQGSVFPCGKKRDFGRGKIFADGVHGGQGQNQVAYGLKPDEQNVVLHGLD
jgi:hypothetical protein